MGNSKESENLINETAIKSGDISENQEDGTLKKSQNTYRTTDKSIQSLEILTCIQTGIQIAVDTNPKPEREPLIQDYLFSEEAYFFKKDSNEYIPCDSGEQSHFRLKLYAPIAFRYFRHLFKIKPDDFIQSLCGHPLKPLINPGASGSLLCISQDDEFVLKSVDSKECKILQAVLPEYYKTLTQFPRTLLPKFFGLYKYLNGGLSSGRRLRLIVMNNLFPSGIEMHQKYDLKGSTYKRQASSAERKKNSPTLKDLDFLEDHKHGIILQEDTWTALIRTLERDTAILERFQIMDYSLLLGVHNVDKAAKENPLLNEVHRSPHPRGRNRRKLVALSTALESIEMESLDIYDELPYGGIPAQNAKGERLLLYLGLIDILQSYRLKKKLEHTFKATIHDGSTVSVHRPGFYAARFMRFVSGKVFQKPRPIVSQMQLEVSDSQQNKKKSNGVTGCCCFC